MSNPKQGKILLFIPLYNCEKQIVRVLNQLKGEVLDYISEVIVVNNRSTDGSEAAIVQLAQLNAIPIPIKLLRNDDNYGLGGSHKVAFNYAEQNDFDYIIVLHGDDQGRIQDIVPLLKSGEYTKHDCCLGARFMKDSVLSGYSKFRAFGNKVYNLLFSIVCGRKVYDLGSGLNLYKVQILKENYYHNFPDNLTFNYCMVMALQHYKQEAMFFPISWREEDQVSNVKLFSQAFKVLHMLGGYAFNHKKFMAIDWRAIARDVYRSKLIFDSRVGSAS